MLPDSMATSAPEHSEVHFELSLPPHSRPQGQEERLQKREQKQEQKYEEEEEGEQQWTQQQEPSSLVLPLQSPSGNACSTQSNPSTVENRFLSLPSEVLMELTDFLDFHTLLALSLTHPYLHALIPLSTILKGRSSYLSELLKLGQTHLRNPRCLDPGRHPKTTLCYSCLHLLPVRKFPHSQRFGRKRSTYLEKPGRLCGDCGVRKGIYQLGSRLLGGRSPDESQTPFGLSHFGVTGIAIDWLELGYPLWNEESTHPASNWAGLPIDTTEKYVKNPFGKTYRLRMSRFLIVCIACGKCKKNFEFLSFDSPDMPAATSEAWKGPGYFLPARPSLDNQFESSALCIDCFFIALRRVNDISSLPTNSFEVWPPPFSQLVLSTSSQRCPDAMMYVMRSEIEATAQWYHNPPALCPFRLPDHNEVEIDRMGHVMIVRKGRANRCQRCWATDHTQREGEFRVGTELLCKICFESWKEREKQVMMLLEEARREEDGKCVPGTYEEFAPRPLEEIR